MHIITQNTKSDISAWLFISLTNGGFAEFLIRHLISDICSHQDAHLDAQLLMNNLWDQLQSVRAFVHPLNPPHAESSFVICVKCDFPLYDRLLSKEKMAQSVYIYERTWPWWVTFPARPVWFCPSWCHKHDRWTDVESQRAGYRRSWRRRADLAPPPVSERKREKNLFDTEWWNLEKHACNQCIHYRIGYTYSMVLCFMCLINFISGSTSSLFANKSFWFLYRVSVASANGFLGLQPSRLVNLVRIEAFGWLWAIWTTGHNDGETTCSFVSFLLVAWVQADGFLCKAKQQVPPRDFGGESGGSALFSRLLYCVLTSSILIICWYNSFSGTTWTVCLCG